MAEQKTEQQASARDDEQVPTTIHTDVLGEQGQEIAEPVETRVPSRPLMFVDPLHVFLNPGLLVRRIQQKTGAIPEVQVDTSVPWVPVSEVEYRDGNLVISVELPGITMEEAHVEIIDNVLIVQGERKRKPGKKVRGNEHRYGRFVREFVLPDGADAEHARAEMGDGILRVTIPLRQTEQSRRKLPIGTSAPSQPISRQEQSPADATIAETANPRKAA